MVLVGLFKWWYSEGWSDQLSRSLVSLRKTADYFSIGLLLKTLFSPFRQIASDETGRDISSKMAAMLDRLLSRTIGAFMRIFMIVTGAIFLLIKSIFIILELLIWPLLPAIPVVGIILSITVGAPWKII